jgi:uncharacterized membrane protein
MSPMFWIVLLTLLPTLELRASIPYGLLGTSLPVWQVVMIAVITNIVLGKIAFVFLDKVVHVFLRNKKIAKWYHGHVDRAQKKVKPYVDKYGFLGLAIFIGIPLPLSGSYTGALAAYFLGFRYKQFFLANALGVCIAATLVTLIVLSGAEVWMWMVKV